MFVAPFTFGCGEGGEDIVVSASGVRVRSAPQSTASVLALVSYAILRVDPEASEAGWQAVRLPDGRRGFVAHRFVRSPIGYRAYFIKVNGVWKLSAFVGGD